MMLIAQNPTTDDVNNNSSTFSRKGYPERLLLVDTQNNYFVLMKCSRCSNILNRPVQCLQGHCYCKACFDEAVSLTESCSECNNGIVLTSSLPVSAPIVGIIGSYPVQCKNSSKLTDHERECSWQGKLSELEAHLSSECQYEVISCPHATGHNCKFKCLRKDMQANHLSIDCLYEEDECIYKTMGQCTLDCPGKLTRQNLFMHMFDPSKHSLAFRCLKHFKTQPNSTSNNNDSSSSSSSSNAVYNHNDWFDEEFARTIDYVTTNVRQDEGRLSLECGNTSYHESFFFDADYDREDNEVDRLDTAEFDYPHINGGKVDTSVSSSSVSCSSSSRVSKNKSKLLENIRLRTSSDIVVPLSSQSSREGVVKCLKTVPVIVNSIPEEFSVQQSVSGQRKRSHSRPPRHTTVSKAPVVSRSIDHKKIKLEQRIEVPHLGSSNDKNGNRRSNSNSNRSKASCSKNKHDMPSHSKSNSNGNSNSNHNSSISNSGSSSSSNNSNGDDQRELPREWDEWLELDESSLLKELKGTTNCVFLACALHVGLKRGSPLLIFEVCRHLTDICIDTDDRGEELRVILDRQTLLGSGPSSIITTIVRLLKWQIVSPSVKLLDGAAGVIQKLTRNFSSCMDNYSDYLARSTQINIEKLVQGDVIQYLCSVLQLDVIQNIVSGGKSSSNQSRLVSETPCRILNCVFNIAYHSVPYKLMFVKHGIVEILVKFMRVAKPTGCGIWFEGFQESLFLAVYSLIFEVESSSDDSDDSHPESHGTRSADSSSSSSDRNVIRPVEEIRRKFVEEGIIPCILRFLNTRSKETPRVIKFALQRKFVHDYTAYANAADGNNDSDISLTKSSAVDKNICLANDALRAICHVVDCLMDNNEHNIDLFISKELKQRHNFKVKVENQTSQDEQKNEVTVQEEDQDEDEGVFTDGLLSAIEVLIQRIPHEEDSVGKLVMSLLCVIIGNIAYEGAVAGQDAFRSAPPSPSLTGDDTCCSGSSITSITNKRNVFQGLVNLLRAPSVMTDFEFMGDVRNAIHNLIDENQHNRVEFVRLFAHGYLADCLTAVVASEAVASLSAGLTLESEQSLVLRICETLSELTKPKILDDDKEKFTDGSDSSVVAAESALMPLRRPMLTTADTTIVIEKRVKYSSGGGSSSCDQPCSSSGTSGSCGSTSRDLRALNSLCQGTYINFNSINVQVVIFIFNIVYSNNQD